MQQFTNTARACCLALTTAVVPLSVAATARATSTPTNELKAPAPQREVVDRVVAVIEDDIITWRELQEKAHPFMAQLDQIADVTTRAAREKELYGQVLDIEIGERMVNRELQQNRDKLGVSEEEIDKAVDSVIRDNNITRDQLQAALYGQGMTWSEYRKKLREQMERARLIQFRVQGKVQLKEADVVHRCEQRSRQSGTQVCASHILLAVSEGATAEQLEGLRLRASRLQAEVANGADFAAYAMKYSDDKAAPDGKLGCFGRGEMVQAFEDAAFGMQVGAISPVVQTPFGFHIIKVTDRRAAPTGSCSDEQTLAGVRNELYQEEMERQMKLWVAELRKKSFVDIRL